MIIKKWPTFKSNSIMVISEMEKTKIQRKPDFLRKPVFRTYLHGAVGNLSCVTTRSLQPAHLKNLLRVGSFVYLCFSSKQR